MTVEHLDRASSDSEGVSATQSDVYVPLCTQVSVSSMDGSCGSDEDKPRRVIQQSFPEGGGAADGDIIPVVTITEDQACAIAAASATHVSGSRNPTGSSEWSEVKGKVQSPLEGKSQGSHSLYETLNEIISLLGCFSMYIACMCIYMCLCVCVC